MHRFCVIMIFTTAKAGTSQGIAKRRQREDFTGNGVGLIFGESGILFERSIPKMFNRLRRLSAYLRVALGRLIITAKLEITSTIER